MLFLISCMVRMFSILFFLVLPQVTLRSDLSRTFRVSTAYIQHWIPWDRLCSNLGARCHGTENTEHRLRMKKGSQGIELIDQRVTTCLELSLSSSRQRRAATGVDAIAKLVSSCASMTYYRIRFAVSLDSMSLIHALLHTSAPPAFLTPASVRLSGCNSSVSFVYLELTISTVIVRS